MNLKMQRLRCDVDVKWESCVENLGHCADPMIIIGGDVV